MSIIKRSTRISMKVLIVVAIMLSISILPALSATTLPCLISGTVTVNGVPTAGVSVTCTGLSSPYTTDTDGTYYISVPGNGQMVTVTASYQGHSMSSDPFAATGTALKLDIPLTYSVATPTPTPTVTVTPTASANATATPTATATATPTPTPTATPTATATAHPTTASSHAAAATPMVVYVTVTVTPEPTVMSNTTDLINLNDTPTSTPIPLPSATTTKSPGFGGIIVLASLAGVALVMLRRSKR